MLFSYDSALGGLYLFPDWVNFIHRMLVCFGVCFYFGFMLCLCYYCFFTTCFLLSFSMANLLVRTILCFGSLCFICWRRSIISFRITSYYFIYDHLILMVSCPFYCSRWRSLNFKGTPFLPFYSLFSSF